MGPQAAVNAVYYNKLQAVPEAERPALTQQLREEYQRDIDLTKVASELIVDDVIPFESLRSELTRRFALHRGRSATPKRRKHIVMPM